MGNIRHELRVERTKIKRNRPAKMDRQNPKAVPRTASGQLSKYGDFAKKPERLQRNAASTTSRRAKMTVRGKDASLRAVAFETSAGESAEESVMQSSARQLTALALASADGEVSISFVVFFVPICGGLDLTFSFPLDMTPIKKIVFVVDRLKSRSNASGTFCPLLQPSMSHN
jgi:hypothetical protein